MAKIKGVFLPDVVTISTNVSPDKQAAGAIIEKLSVSLGGVRGPLTATRTATVYIPFDENDGEVTIDQQVRGFVDLTPGARGLLIVQGGGKTVQVDLPDAAASEKDFTKSFTTTLPKGAPYQATFFLLLERDVDDTAIGGVIEVQSLDLEIKPTPQGKY